MTENESLSTTLQNAIDCATDDITREDLEMMVKCLEELQQYRAIGTVEELTALKENCIEPSSLRLYLTQLEKYYAIGTIDEFKVLKEKNEPKKIDIWANGEEHCPFCDKNLTTFYGFANCFSCGQKLDWSE